MPQRLPLRFVALFLAVGAFLGYQWTVPYREGQFDFADLLLLAGSLVLVGLLPRVLLIRGRVLLLILFAFNLAAFFYWVITVGIAPLVDYGGIVGRIIGLLVFLVLVLDFRLGRRDQTTSDNAK